MVLKDLTGRRFGRLVVTGRADYKGEKIRWTCWCDCGQSRVVHGSALTTGNTTSCGCQRHDTLTIHGRTRTKEYQAWRGAKRRCYAVGTEEWKNYGGRGIKMAPEWEHDFAAFFAHVGECPDGMSLDRIDNDGDYAPGNVRWATPTTQSNNRRTNRFVDFGGVKVTVAQIASAMGIDWKTAKRKYAHE